MMWIRLAALIAAVLLAGLPGRSTGAGSITGWLPSGAREVASAAIPGYPQAVAVLYQSSRTFLGVIQVRSGVTRLVWRHKLPAGSDSLRAPGPSGLFQALVRLPQRPAARLYAFRFQGGGVSSAIEDHPSGYVSGDEGISLGSGRFTVRKRDMAHQGSVAYRTVRYYTLSSSLYAATRTIQVPDYPSGSYPTPNATVRTVGGSLILLRLEVADTEQARETGLMNRASLDPDSGMIFVWTQPSHDSFWMESTYIPLTVAFLDQNGRIQEMQDMQPLTTSLHTPAQPYLYAVEVNQGFFARNGIAVGDTLALHLQHTARR